MQLKQQKGVKSKKGGSRSSPKSDDAITERLGFVPAEVYLLPDCHTVLWAFKLVDDLIGGKGNSDTDLPSEQVTHLASDLTKAG